MSGNRLSYLKLDDDVIVYATFEIRKRVHALDPVVGQLACVQLPFSRRVAL